jgi:hypothetical protein
VVVVVAVIAVVANVVQFRAIDRGEPEYVQSIHHPGTADLLQLMYHGCAGRCTQRYGLAVALGLIAPGSRVIIPTPTPVLADPDTEFIARLRAFGDVARIDRVESGVAGRVMAAVDPTPYIVASGPGGSFGDPWVIAVSPALVPPGLGGDPPNFLHRAVMSGYRPPVADHAEFLLVRWSRSASDQVDLVLDTSLLPRDVYLGLPR